MVPDTVATARALVGTRFGLHGRAAALDCVGLVAAAHGEAEIPTGYPMRSDDADGLARELAQRGFAQVTDLRAADIIVLRPGAAQLHLGIWTGNSLIHADVALHQVVERPGLPPWPILHIWRRRP